MSSDACYSYSPTLGVFESNNLPAVKRDLQGVLNTMHNSTAVVKTRLEERRPIHKCLKRKGEESATSYDPLNLKLPDQLLGLRLEKTPALLNSIQTKLSQLDQVRAQNCSNTVRRGEKVKASNFVASPLRIGSWEYKSRYAGDLVVKTYYSKHKLVWEVLDDNCHKNKIEIQWLDIVHFKANYLRDDRPGTLCVVVSRKPSFFKETPPKPLKHTLWKSTPDFTNGQASMQKVHYLECPQGLLREHFEKMIHCDSRLRFISEQRDMILDSPYFEPRLSTFNEMAEECYPRDVPSHVSVTVSSTAIEDTQNTAAIDQHCTLLTTSAHPSLIHPILNRHPFANITNMADNQNAHVPGTFLW